jgi:hypothetical protein
MAMGAPIPILRIFDEAKAREFYCGFLGFAVDWEHRFHEGAPLYMQVRSGGCVLHLSEHFGDGTPGTILRVPIADLDGFVAALNAKQYKNSRPGIVEQSWGRESSIPDPFNNRLVFYAAP